MAHITAILIILTLAGEPAAVALCIAGCDSPSEMQTCDEAIAPPASASISPTTGLCPLLVSTSLFLRDEGRAMLHRAAVATPITTAPPPAITGRIGAARTNDAPAGRPRPTLILRV